MIEFDFRDQNVIVTGGTRGIGRTISELFLEAGANVMAVYCENDSEAKAFLEENKKCHTQLEIQKCDVTDHIQVKEFYNSYESKHNTLDVLINNSGIRQDKVLALMTINDWQKVIDVNLTGTFNMCKYAILIMLKERYGRIVNISSISATRGLDGQANYGASKAGVMGLSRSLAKEVAKRGITVNNVSPGFILTEFLKGVNPSRIKKYEELIPMGRFGTPKEVASAVLFLASRMSSYISGSTLEIAGGI